MSDAVMELRATSKSYRDVTALHPTDLTVQRGHVHALVGLNGAGKTTLMRLILGVTSPTSGKVTIRGVDLSRMTPAAWEGVGHLIEKPLVYPELTVKQSLYAAARLAGLCHVGSQEAGARLAEDLRLTPWWTRRARSLSMGNRQRLGIASALIAGPEIIVLDEPANGLDPAGIILVRELLRARVERAGATVLVSSHHLDEVARIADEITVINSGRIIGSLLPETVDLERRFFDLVAADAAAVR